MTSDDTEAVSRVGTNVEYGRFWELGFHGIQNVRAHVRRTRNVMGAIDGKRRKIGQGIAFVRGHTRRVDQNPRPFLKPEMDAFRSYARKAMAAAVGARVAEGL